MANRFFFLFKGSLNIQPKAQSREDVKREKSLGRERVRVCACVCVASGWCLLLVKGCCSRTCGEVEIETAVLSNPSCLIAFASVLSFHLSPAPLSFSHSLALGSHKALLIKHAANAVAYEPPVA